MRIRVNLFSNPNCEIKKMKRKTRHMWTNFLKILLQRKNKNKTKLWPKNVLKISVQQTKVMGILRLHIFIGHLAQRSILWNFQLTCGPCVNYELTRSELKMN
jgi:hypothetical protein